ncbi:hypothetical protein N0O92_12520 [Alkalihalobacillus sp. MEB130]|uniref:hypothetical protein n=1 Tax=Alkalihalobacillus sp. MEB130 TaxID=2976704 RepID=UPI0028E0743B|nr:hypothetical protein [Alkalihalobacillus sp. MEB130]MDT8861059.1 hypothetical protein [Alkalihalobacillus sp. MEB130]
MGKKKDRKKQNKDQVKRDLPPLSELISQSETGLIRDLIDEDVLVVLESHQLNILGQTFRPIFTGRIIEVTLGHLTLENVIIKMPNAPFFEFPTPLSFPIEKVVGITLFDPDTIIPLT